MHVDPTFNQTVYPFLDLEEIAASSDVIYILDNDLILRGYNDAWVNFARENNGQEILQLYQLGSNITNCFKEPFHSYYTKSYKLAIAVNQPFSQIYECHSDSTFRTFKQFAYPINGTKGLIISNHLILQKPHWQQSQAFTVQLINRDGFIVQCSNCRKTRNPDNVNQWYWVPELLLSTPPNISHSICPQCLEHFYPNLGG